MRGMRSPKGKGKGNGKMGQFMVPKGKGTGKMRLPDPVPPVPPVVQQEMENNADATEPASVSIVSTDTEDIGSG